MPEYVLDHGIFKPTVDGKSAIRAQRKSATQTAAILAIEDETGANLSGFDKRGGLVVPSLTAVGVADFAISAAWGATATVSAASGNDQRGSVSITAGGAGLAVGGTCILTFKTAWGATPGGIFTRGDANAPAGETDTTTLSTTQIGLTFRGLPVNAVVYTFRWLVIG